MSTALKNTLVAVVLMGVIGVAGGYWTVWHQPKRIAKLQERSKVLRLRKAKLAKLFEEQASTKKQARDLQRRWRTRYKEVPDTLRASSVIDYLNQRTDEGYDHFRVTLAGVQHNRGFSNLRFQIEGVGYFAYLYRLLWEIEQQHQLYKIDNLTIQHQNVIDGGEESGSSGPRYIMTDFSFDLTAYFGGLPRLSHPDTLRSVPLTALPASAPTVNPFYPVIMQDLPPNHHNRVNVETAQLVSIVGEEAVFRQENQNRRVGEGERVYLGRLVQVDPSRGRVVARLNKGGIVDRVVLEVNSENARPARFSSAQ